MIIRSYSELIRLNTFEERYEYLRLRGDVGRSTFGFDRYLNQQFYRSAQWRNLRHHIIARDLGCDLAVEGYEIHDKILIHHMNPIDSDDIIDGNSDIMEPEFLISTTQKTHNDIHYGNDNRLPSQLVERRPGDTKLW